MSGEVRWNGDKVLKQVTDDVGQRSGSSGSAGYDAAYNSVPVVTGNLQRSIGWATFGPDGSFIAGMHADENGEAIPSPGATGRITTVIVANAPYAEKEIGNGETFMDSAGIAAGEALVRELGKGDVGQ